MFYLLLLEAVTRYTYFISTLCLTQHSHGQVWTVEGSHSKLMKTPGEHANWEMSQTFLL